MQAINRLQVSLGYSNAPREFTHIPCDIFCPRVSPPEQLLGEARVGTPEYGPNFWSSSCLDKTRFPNGACRTQYDCIVGMEVRAKHGLPPLTRKEAPPQPEASVREPDRCACGGEVASNHILGLRKISGYEQKLICYRCHRNEVRAHRRDNDQRRYARLKEQYADLKAKGRKLPPFNVWSKKVKAQ